MFFTEQKIYTNATFTPEHTSSCSDEMVKRYHKRLPLLEEIDNKKNIICLD